MATPSATYLAVYATTLLLWALGVVHCQFVLHYLAQPSLHLATVYTFTSVFVFLLQPLKPCARSRRRLAGGGGCGRDGSAEETLYMSRAFAFLLGLGIMILVADTSEWGKAVLGIPFAATIAVVVYAAVQD